MKKFLLFSITLLLASVLFAQESRAGDYTGWGLPDGALARLGKGGIDSGDCAVAYSPYGGSSKAAPSTFSERVLTCIITHHG